MSNTDPTKKGTIHSLIWGLVFCDVVSYYFQSFWVNLHEVIQILLDTETKVPDDIEIGRYIFNSLEMVGSG
jgi:hypothetical protein